MADIVRLKHKKTGKTVTLKKKKKNIEMNPKKRVLEYVSKNKA